MNAFPVAKKIKVGLDFGKGTIPVGRLAIRERRIYFAYESTFIEQGLEISPFILPLKAGVTNFDNSFLKGCLEFSTTACLMAGESSCLTG